MKRPLLSWKYLLLVAGLIVAACIAVVIIAALALLQRPPEANPKMLVVGSEASGKVIVVSGRDTVSIKLLGNASTGYHWELVSVTGDSLEALAESHADPLSPIREPRPGDAEYGYCDFRVRAVGQTRILLEYRAPNPGQAPAETFSATFDVRDTVPPTTSSAPATTRGLPLN